MADLKPCPWCGGRAQFYREGLADTPGIEMAAYRYRIRCPDCGAWNGKSFTIIAHFDPRNERGVTANVLERDKAVMEWNRRAGETQKCTGEEDET